MNVFLLYLTENTEKQKLFTKFSREHRHTDRKTKEGEINHLQTIKRATSWENLFKPYVNNKGADQPAALL